MAFVLHCLLESAIIESTSANPAIGYDEKDRYVKILSLVVSGRGRPALSARRKAIISISASFANTMNTTHATIAITRENIA